MPRGDLSAARRAYAESLELNRQAADRRGVAYGLSGLGQIARDEGQFAAAARLYKEATTLRIEIGEKLELVKSIETFGMLAFARGEAKEGVRLMAAAEALRLNLGAPLEPYLRTPADERLMQARTALGDPAYDALWQDGQRMGMDEALALALADTPDVKDQEASG